MTAPEEEVPSGVYYSGDGGNFYSIQTKTGMGTDFWRKWQSRRAEFPQSEAAALSAIRRPAGGEVGELVKRIEREIQQAEEAGFGASIGFMREAAAALLSLVSERDAVIEECAKAAERAHLVPPDGGSPSPEECAVAEEAARAIRALKTE